MTTATSLTLHPIAREGDVELNLCYRDELTIEQLNAPLITKHFGQATFFSSATQVCRYWWLSPGIQGRFALPNFVFSDAD